MRAETAYNVIQALPEDEAKRLFKLLGFNQNKKTNKKKKKETFTVHEAIDNILSTYL